MKNDKLSICDQQILPGERVNLALPLPEFFSCAPLYMPIKVIHGKKPGPCILVTAAMHGNELNGTETINRLLDIKALSQLSGTLIAAPVLNVYGFLNRSRYLPGGLELDRCFPGSDTGSHAARIAHTFIKNIFCLADICIDLQTGFQNCSNFPQIYITKHDDAAQELAQAFQAPVISTTEPTPSSLREQAFKANKPYLCYEAGEAMRFDEQAIKTGVQGILNVMRKLNMLPAKKIKAPRNVFTTESTLWVRASTSGISHTNIQLGQAVKRGDTLCVIKDPFGASESEVVVCPEDAIIVSKNNLPLVHEGECIFQLSVFPKMADVAEHLEEWHENNSHSTESNQVSS